MKKLAVFILLVLAGKSIPVVAQEIPLGTWRTHLSYSDVTHVVSGDDFIFAAVSAGIFYVDLRDNSINRLTALDGLQGGNISALNYDAGRNMLLVGYATGNLDLITDTRIQNLDLTSSSQVIGSKKINAIQLAGAFAYLATDFGVLKFSLERAEVRETYREIGPEGEQIAVSDLAIYQDSLFIASPGGIRAGSLNETNLADWRFWVQKALPVGGDPVGLAAAGTSLFTAIDASGILVYDNGAWNNASPTPAQDYRRLTGRENSLIVVSSEAVEERSADDLSLISSASSPLIADPQDALRTEGAWWVADGENGLLSDETGSFDSYSPSGPASTGVFAMEYLPDSVYVLTGGYSSLVQPLGRNDGVHIFSGGQWVNRFGGADFGDFTDVAGMPGGGALYYASAGDGLLRVSDGGIEVIDEDTPGSPLVNPGAPARGLIIPSVEADNGGIWVLNYDVPASLHYLQADGAWTSYEVPVNQARFAVEVLPVGDLVWLRVAPSRGGGLVVFDPASGAARYLTRAPDNGSLPSLRVNDLELDRDGFLWLATDAGVAIITNPFTLQGNINAVEPVFEGRPLLIDEEVTAIRVDGGNRKWMGTLNGAWLFDASADELLLRFTRENSPLPASEIRSLSIMGNTGEIFFGTDQGIVSYRSDATTGAAEHADVKIFPNPVRADFQGVVGISGLVENAEVKITDSAGRLIYRTRASGGTASWPIDGERLQSGMYMVFSATPDGSETFVGKVAVIR